MLREYDSFSNQLIKDRGMRTEALNSSVTDMKRIWRAAGVDEDSISLQTNEALKPARSRKQVVETIYIARAVKGSIVDNKISR